MSGKLNFCICIVIYKQNLGDTDTFNSLKLVAKGRLIDLLVYDNSEFSDETIETIKNDNPLINISYYHNFLNLGVSGAYNYAIDFAKIQNKQWLLLFDQDSIINPKFLTELEKAVNANPDVKLFCPLVISNKIQVSPITFLFGRSFIKTKFQPGKVCTKHHSIINSGVLINLNELEKIGGYDQYFPLDFSDHYFFHKYKKTNSFFYVLDVKNDHSLSSLNEHNASVILNRFKIYFNASVLFAKKTGNVFVVFWAVLRALKLSLKFKNLNFLNFIIFSNKQKPI